MAEHVLIVEDGVPVAGVQKTTICTFTIKGEEENEGLYPRILFLDVVPHNMPRSVSSTSDNGGYVNRTEVLFTKIRAATTVSAPLYPFSRL
jgi:hypothetical protein